MFNPSRDQVRSFFIDTWRKYQAKEVLTAMETVAADIIALHPEYHAVVEDPDAIDRDFPPESGQINPFLHLSVSRCRATTLGEPCKPSASKGFEV